ncbi:alkyl sulfatase C-terminal domain-containing protein [Holdemania massiliensis]|nr:alkyl sulfatase C-terminal domain-containing protein [Holdemania massiliensis]
MPRWGMAAILSHSEELQAKRIQIDGDPQCLSELTEAMADFDKKFVIIEP